MTVKDPNSAAEDSATKTSTGGSNYAGTRIFNSRTFTGGTGASTKSGPPRL